MKDPQLTTHYRRNYKTEMLAKPMRSNPVLRIEGFDYENYEGYRN